MPISPMTFENLKVPERVNPMSRALQSALQMFQQGANTAYTLPNLKADLEKKQLDNTINQPKADYAKEITLADLFNKRANTSLTQKQADFYEPDILSQIGFRNAQTSAIPTEIGLNKQKILEAIIKNKYLGEKEQAEIDEKNSMSDYYKMGGRSSAGSAGESDRRSLQRQLMLDNPNWTPETANQAASAYLSGNSTLPGGEKLPPLSGLAQSSLAQIQKRNSNAAVQNQAANMSILADDINDINIDPLKKFVGISGRGKVADYTAKMALGREVPQEFRDYLSFKKVTSNFAMDALRKGFGTSVVPDYVYKTLGQAANPASTWWYDPEQVQNDWDATKIWINKNAKSYTKKATQGIGYDTSTNNSSNTNLSNPNASPTAVWKRVNGKLVRQ